MRTTRLSSSGAEFGSVSSVCATSIDTSADDDSLPCTPKASQAMAGVLFAISFARACVVAFGSVSAATFARIESSAARFFGDVITASISGRCSYVSPNCCIVIRFDRVVSRWK